MGKVGEKRAGSGEGKRKKIKELKHSRKISVC